MSYHSRNHYSTYPRHHTVHVADPYYQSGHSSHHRSPSVDYYYPSHSHSSYQPRHSSHHHSRSGSRRSHHTHNSGSTTRYYKPRRTINVVSFTLDLWNRVEGLTAIIDLEGRKSGYET